MRNWIGLALLLVFGRLYGQEIRGQVIDSSTGEGLVGATIQAAFSEGGAVSDVNGEFILVMPSSGVYSITVSYIGFQKLEFPEVWVKEKGVTELKAELIPTADDLQEVVITDTRTLTTPGRLVITEEQIGRFASTYYDPSRMATTISDAVVTNDQNNRISVRGVSPAYNVWRLEGAEILNPNHLSNAGTFSDQPTASGGGVNILSAQMIGNSSFMYGHMTSGYGNTVGGLFDMQVKTGNRDQLRFVTQASLIGFDLAADGPLSKSKRATFAMNYRYSFTGLLAAFGVDFGGEKIGFQDLSFSLNFPVGEKSTLKVFGLGGVNYNEFAGSGIVNAEVEKDLYNIDFNSNMSAVGISVNSKLSSWKLTESLVYSRSESQWEKSSVDIASDAQGLDRESNLISNRLDMTRIFRKVTLSQGFLTNVVMMKDSSRYLSFGPTGDFAYSVNSSFFRVLLNPYVNSEFRVNDRVSARLGLSISNTDGKQTEVDPRLGLVFGRPQTLQASISAGRYSQMYKPGNYIFTDERYTGKFPDRFISSMRYIVDLKKTSERTTNGLSFFYYYFDQVYLGVTGRPSSDRLGMTYFHERTLAETYYVRLGLTAYHQALSEGNRYKYEDVTNTSVSIGKNWVLKKGTLGLNARGLYQKGLNKSNEEYIGNDVYPYFRTDVRLIWTTSKSGRSQSVALDIQNVTNHQNVFYKHYDDVQGKFTTQYQLGLIPILTYRLDF